mmetsp:Transcript_12488/g.17934  ORF Transcript_12488/g.17934 Transcript_12488/m.17934 type:complete len:261 (-) Transcript_12488:327-1109(-)
MLQTKPPADLILAVAFVRLRVNGEDTPSNRFGIGFVTVVVVTRRVGTRGFQLSHCVRQFRLQIRHLALQTFNSSFLCSQLISLRYLFALQPINSVFILLDILFILLDFVHRNMDIVVLLLNLVVLNRHLVHHRIEFGVVLVVRLHLSIRQRIDIVTMPAQFVFNVGSWWSYSVSILQISWRLGDNTNSVTTSENISISASNTSTEGGGGSGSVVRLDNGNITNLAGFRIIRAVVVLPHCSHHFPSFYVTLSATFLYDFIR